MTAPTPIGQTGKWNLIFDDEFNGTTLDKSKWNTCYPTYGVGNGSCHFEHNEQELYMPTQEIITNGILNLRAEKKTTTIAGTTYNYASGMISTGPDAYGSPTKFSFVYGFMEERAKVPKGKGMWPAFWAIPTNLKWLPEIDVQEVIGDKPNEINMNYHNNGNGDKGSVYDGSDFSADFHTYAVQWDPTAIVWYIDGVEHMRVTTGIANVPLYLIANLAVGGDWPGNPDSTTQFPNNYQIDYMRVWQKADGSVPTSNSPIPFPSSAANPSPTQSSTQPSPSNVQPTFVCIVTQGCISGAPTPTIFNTTPSEAVQSSTAPINSLVPSLSEISETPSPSINQNPAPPTNGNQQGLIMQLLKIIQQIIDLIKNLLGEHTWH